MKNQFRKSPNVTVNIAKPGYIKQKCQKSPLLCFGYLRNKKIPNPMMKGVSKAAIKNDNAGTREAIDSSPSELMG